MFFYISCQKTHQLKCFFICHVKKHANSCVHVSYIHINTMLWHTYGSRNKLSNTLIKNNKIITITK